MLVTVGTAVDADTFVAPGPPVTEAGNGLPAATVLAGLGALATASGGAQLGAAIPVSGGGFTWARALGQNALSFIAGMSSIGKEIVVQSVNALTLVVFAQLIIPGLLLHPLGAGITVANTILNSMSVASTAKIVAGLTAALVAVLGGYCGLVAPAVRPDNLLPLLGPARLALSAGRVLLCL